MMTISFSLWGEDEKYRFGLRRNLELIPKVYPDARVCVWTEVKLAGQLVDVLHKSGVPSQICIPPPSLWKDGAGYLWRFLSLKHCDLRDIVLVRDLDSRPSFREASAVREWETVSDNQFIHSMHDHPHHTAPLMGGGLAVRGPLPGIEEELIWWANTEPLGYWTDERFLAQYLNWPLREGKVLHHSSIPLPWPSRPFPLHPDQSHFVLQQFDQHDTPRWPPGPQSFPIVPTL